MYMYNLYHDTMVHIILYYMYRYIPVNTQIKKWHTCGCAHPSL